MHRLEHMAPRFSYYMYLVCSLEELYLSGNAYEDFTLNIPAYPSLRLLQLTSNKLTDWRYVVKLDRIFPNLRNLTLARNKIEQCGNFYGLEYGWIWIWISKKFLRSPFSFRKLLIWNPDMFLRNANSFLNVARSVTLSWHVWHAWSSFYIQMRH